MTVGLKRLKYSNCEPARQLSQACMAAAAAAGTACIGTLNPDVVSTLGDAVSAHPRRGGMLGCGLYLGDEVEYR